ncbi:MAG: DUF6088 family protein [Prevotellaceae bacterium]|jgi:hypothetical protein|nr:DUF6088 family protein [Prevotellaceae bacterium]
MISFKSDILKQIERIPEGKIFTFRDITFPMAKFANIAVILSELSKEGQLVRFEKGAYYRPKQSSLGLGILPVYQDEQIIYLTTKLDGYLTGTYIYNKMSLTEQVPSVVTVAVRYPVRPFRLKKLSVECVKSYVEKPVDAKTLHLIQVLDAIKDLKHIPATSPQTVYERIYNLHLSVLSEKELKKIVSLSLNYPPRVRKILSDMLERRGESNLQERLLQTICPTTRFYLPYKN